MKKFESFLRSKLLAHPTELDTEALWRRLQRKRKRRRLLFWWFFAVGVSVMAGTAFFLLKKPFTPNHYPAQAQRATDSHFPEANAGQMPPVRLAPGELPTQGSFQPRPTLSAAAANAAWMDAAAARQAEAQQPLSGTDTVAESRWARTTYWPLPPRPQSLPEVPKDTFTPDRLPTKPPLRSESGRWVWWTGVGAGPSFRSAEESASYPGLTTGLTTFQWTAQGRRFFKRGWFAEGGLQIQHGATRVVLRSTFTQQSVHSIVPVVSGSSQLQLQYDTVWQQQTTTRSLRQHQYLSSAHLTGGVGKQWRYRRWSVDMGVQLAKGLIQIGRGDFPDANGQLRPLNEVIQKTPGWSAQAYGQIAYAFTPRAGCLLRLGYWHHLDVVDREGTYRLPYGMFGWYYR